MRDSKFTPTQEFNDIIDRIESRAMAVDGPVTPTLQEATEEELSRLWELVNTIRKENAQLEMALVTRDGMLTRKLMAERNVKLSEALKQAKEALELAWDKDLRLVKPALDTINKLGL